MTLATLTAGLAAGTSASSQGENPLACPPHPPIDIEGNEELGLPGSGVVNPTAEGTEEDPYVIEGWCIDGDDWREIPLVSPFQGIAVEDTDAHLVIRDTEVTDHGLQGIVLEEASNVSVRDNLVASNGWSGIDLRSTQNSSVASNLVIDNGSNGVTLLMSDGNTVEANTAKDNDRSGILLGNDPSVAGGGPGASEDNTVTGNLATDNAKAGIALWTAHQNTVTANAVRDNGLYGLWSSIAHDNAFVGNDARDNDAWGVFVRGSAGETVAENRLEGNGGGVHVSTAADTDVRHNSIHGSQEAGIAVRGASEGTTIQANLIASNDPGVLVTASEDGEEPSQTRVSGNDIVANTGVGLAARSLAGPVDATENWWGAASGPSGGVEDACTGEVADGDGQAIVVAEAAVCFDPWLGSPNPDAGAS